MRLDEWMELNGITDPVDAWWILALAGGTWPEPGAPEPSEATGGDSSDV